MNGFAALMYRMNYINRWGLMRNSRPESLSEHSLCVSYIAHILCAIAKVRYDAPVDIDRTVCAALYHDAGEIMTGDLPTPVKYANKTIHAAYKNVEENAVERLTALLPVDLAPVVRSRITGEDLNDRERAIVKAADKICAYIKCIEEQSAGNREFDTAKQSTLALLLDQPLPETKDFIEEFIPAYSMTLDQLMSMGGPSPSR